MSLRRKQKSALRRMNDQLFDSWEELRCLAVAETEAFAKWQKLVQVQFDGRSKAHTELVKGWAELVTLLERRRMNIEARLREKAKMPFPKESGRASELYRKAQEAIAHLKSRAGVRDAEGPEEEAVQFLADLEEEYEAEYGALPPGGEDPDLEDFEAEEFPEEEGEASEEGEGETSEENLLAGV